LEEEECDFEALLENLAGLNALYEKRDKLVAKRESHEKEINHLNQGRSSLKTLFTFKSKKDDIAAYENEKVAVWMFVKFFFIIQFEQQIDQQNLIIKFATVHTFNLIENFKAEKLNGYYESLRSCSEVQLKNSEHVRDRLLK